MAPGVPSMALVVEVILRERTYNFKGITVNCCVFVICLGFLRGCGCCSMLNSEILKEQKVTGRKSFRFCT